MTRTPCAWLIGIALAASATRALSAQTVAGPQDFRVTLLGTGSPNLSVDRFGPSTLVVAGNQRLLFDVGRGATIRLAQADVPLRDISAVFLTHLHSDHVNGLSDLWLTGWLPAPYGQRMTAFRVYGPTGTRDMMSHLEQAHQADIRIRMADEQLSPTGIAIDATDVTEGIAYERNGVRVTVFDVDHGALIKPALGYRVDFRGRSVVLSGDTRFSTNLVKHARGADVVIHEVMAAADDLLATEAGRRIMAHHTSPEEAGRVFAETKPRLAVYSHVIARGVSVDDLIRRTRTAYAGALEVGSDLMTIEVNDVPRVTRRDATPR
jgi:ribonuclease Z